MRTYFKFFLALIAVFIAGTIFGGNMVWAHSDEHIRTPSPEVVSVKSERQRDDHDAALTSPLLDCTDTSQGLNDAEVIATKSAINDLIASRQKSGDITNAAVYYRDLTNGPWFGINEAQKFFPASLLKIPLAMSFYSKADTDPTVMTKMTKYVPDPSLALQIQPYAPQKNVEAGKSYSTKELITIMLQDSSNEAAVMLAEIAGITQIDSIYRDLGIPIPTPGHDYQIDTHTYSSFFRVLYNATYLHRPASEEILQTLTSADFPDGLVAGVPVDVVVSHKFGSRQVDQARSIVQLHDCGIIYAKNTPYILCVMTQGGDFNKLAGFIKDVSSTVYKNVIAN